MSLEEKIHEGRSILGKAINFVAPFRYKAFGEHFQAARGYDPVQEVFRDYSHSPEAQRYLEERLAYHIQQSRRENRLLKFSGGVTDSIDKLLALPNLIPGIGYVSRIPKAVIEWPMKIANSMFYRGKTGDKQFLKDIGFEVGTDLLGLLPWDVGSLIDIGNRYSFRVDKYVARKAAADFVTEVRTKGIAPAGASQEELRARRKGRIDITAEPGLAPAVA